jgi:hypothetical protein
MEYSKATGAKVLHQLNDYPKCPQLARDLNKLVSYKLVRCKRSFLYDLSGFMVLPRSSSIYTLTSLSATENTWVDR